MRLSSIGLLSAAAAVFVLGSSTPSLACFYPGQTSCTSGYLYTCQCYTGSGCTMVYSGRCRMRSPAEAGPFSLFAPDHVALPSKSRRPAKSKTTAKSAPDKK